MADRFPSIEDLDAGHTPAGGSESQGNFLDRERAVLGEDADLFNANDTAHTRKATIEDDEEDLLGGDDIKSGAAHKNASHNGEFDEFESSFPAVNTQNQNVGPGGTVTSSSGGGYTNYTPQGGNEEDSEPIRAWRTQRDAEIGRRDEASERKKQETVSTAQKDIDSFYETYNRKMEKQKAQVAKEAEEFLTKREDTTAGGTSWERIGKLVDLSGKGQQGGGDGSTKKRMREMLLSLKGDKEAPGAGGI